MDALDVLRVCVRRWYVMLPVLMMALGTGYALAANQQASYYASSTFAFVYQGADPAQQELRVLNPLADTQLLGTALGLSLAAPEMQEELGDEDASGVAPGEASDYRRFAFSGAGYTYSVSSWGPTPDVVESTVQNVMDAIPVEVERIQVSAGAPAGTLSTIFVMSPTRVDVVPASSGLKLLIGVGAVGAIAGAALSIALDALLSSRARRRERREPEPLDDDPGLRDQNGAGSASRSARTRSRREVSSPPEAKHEVVQDVEHDASASFEALFR